MIDVGLTLDTSALETLYGGQFTLSIPPIKPNHAAPQFLWKLTLFVHLKRNYLLNVRVCKCLFFIFLQAAFNNLLQECIFLISPLLEDSPAARHHLMMISHRWPTHTVCQAALIVLTYIVPSVILAGPLCNQSSCQWTQTKFVFKVDATTIHRLAI